MWSILIEGVALFLVAWLISIAGDDTEEVRKEILCAQLMLMTPPFVVEWLCIIFFDMSHAIATFIFVGIYILEHIIIISAENIFKR